MHGHFKRRLEQHLLLRGSRDFESEEAYDLFVRRRKFFSVKVADDFF
jgi:hypothetical protein